MGVDGRAAGAATAIALAVLVIVATALPAAAAPVAPAQPSPPVDDRFALAGSCVAVRVGSSGDAGHLQRAGSTLAATADLADAEPFRLQATDLGRYLLYGSAGDVAAGEGTSVVVAASPSPSADWSVDDRGDAFALRLPATGQVLVRGPDGAIALARGGVAAPVELVPTSGCATYPEVELNVSGPHATGPTADGEVQGFVDTHLHVTAHEFLGGKVHCGRPWHAYGAPYALVDCPDHSLTGGAGAVLENLLSGGLPVEPHDTVGWPTFADWPAPASLTHEQTYYRWLERAWRGGLRVMVNLFVENRVLCEIYPLKQNDCDEMASVRLQSQRIHELERYIDAQSGGPGQGWFRIVDDPAEARAVANQGKLAVVLGVELSEPFRCRSFLGEAQCTAADIDAELDELHALGVRQLVVIHKFDNALGGVAGDGGTKGAVINVGNLYGTGRFWDFETCDPDDTGVHDNDQELVPGSGEHTALFGAILSAFGPAPALPVYPPPHHCNVLGLSDLGAHAIEAMAERGMIVDVDHMSVRARQEALDLLEARRHPGVISSHSWSTPDAYGRIYALGGMTGPYAGGSEGFVRTWRERKAAADPRYAFGLGYGADSNGLGAQGEPRGADVENPVTYPFTGLGGVVIDRQVSGTRVYDINVDGVAHYGLYPDWIEDLRRQAGDEIVADLARGAEAYLQMWERADAARVAAPSLGASPSATPSPGAPAPAAPPGGAPGPLPATGAAPAPAPLLAALLAGLGLAARRAVRASA